MDRGGKEENVKKDEGGGNSQTLPRLHDPYNQVPAHLPLENKFLYRNSNGTYLVTPKVVYEAELIYTPVEKEDCQSTHDQRRCEGTCYQQH